MPAADAILTAAETEQFRAALRDYTVPAVHDLLGPIGQAAQARGDQSGVARQLRGRSADPVATLVTLFLLGGSISAGAARAALAPLRLRSALRAGLVETDGDDVRALLEVRPYSETARPALVAGCDPPPADPWWVVSDLGSDVRRGPLAADHVQGIGLASLSLAQATPRAPVASALDVGTGCGIQALHLTRHSASVTATDVSERALRFAATTAALSGQQWHLRAGSLLRPVAGERFELIVANPPFVVSDGRSEHTYRDGGQPGDGLCRDLVRALPGHLTSGGTGQLLANWVIPRDGDWQQRVGGWLTGGGCDAWVWQREVADPGEYVTMWLRDAGELPGTTRWTARYDGWLDWFAAAGVVAVGMGLITMWRTETADPRIVLEDVAQALEQPVGAHLPGWVRRQRWLASTGDSALLRATLRTVDGVVCTRERVSRPQGWTTATIRLRQSHGMRWDLDTDEAIAAVIGACDGSVPLHIPLAVLAASTGRAMDDVVAAGLPVVRDLVARGFLEPQPPDLGPATA